MSIMIHSMPCGDKSAPNHHKATCHIADPGGMIMGQDQCVEPGFWLVYSSAFVPPWRWGKGIVRSLTWRKLRVWRHPSPWTWSFLWSRSKISFFPCSSFYDDSWREWRVPLLSQTFPVVLTSPLSLSPPPCPLPLPYPHRLLNGCSLHLRGMRAFALAVPYSPPVSSYPETFCARRCLRPSFAVSQRRIPTRWKVHWPY